MPTDAALLGRRPGRVLVTGAAGFIGSHLVDALLARGGTVVGLDCRSPVDDMTAAMNLVESAAHPNLTYVAANLCTTDIAAHAEGCDTVFHLAAVPGVRRSWGDRFGDYVEANLIGTHRLLQACHSAGVRRLVVASSSSVYGPVTAPSREGDLTRPISPYAVTKLAAENLCLAHARRDDAVTSVVVLRYFTVYGPRQRADMAIGRILSASLTGVPFELYGDGTQRREFTYVSDAIDATLAAATCEGQHAVVNVGGGATSSMIDLLAVASRVTGRPVPMTATSAASGDVPATCADLTLARLLLKYEPHVDLRDGIQHQLDWLMDLEPDQRRALLADQLQAVAT